MVFITLPLVPAVYTHLLTKEQELTNPIVDTKSRRLAPCSGLVQGLHQSSFARCATIPSLFNHGNKVRRHSDVTRDGDVVKIEAPSICLTKQCASER